MRDFTVKESEEGEIVMGGMLTIENAAELRRTLYETLKKRRQVIITVGDDASADLSFLQILCSLHRTAQRADKTVAQGRYSGPFVSMIVDAGFARCRGCIPGSENNCLWIIGGKK